MNTFFDVWVVKETIDEYGRPGQLVGVFTSEDSAKTAAHKRGWWGGEGEITKKLGMLNPVDNTEIIVIDMIIKPNVYLIEATKNDRAAALAKLTPRERELLGVKE